MDKANSLRRHLLDAHYKRRIGDAIRRRGNRCAAAQHYLAANTLLGISARILSASGDTSKAQPRNALSELGVWQINSEAELLRQWGHLADALVLYSRVYCDAVEHLGVEHPMCAIIMGNQGLCFLANEKPGLARRYLERAVQMLKSAVPHSVYTTELLVGAVSEFNEARDRAA
jgi:hypothetical protein